MGMANIPNVSPDINLSREDVINLLLASIAFEELGLAHIVNAEAEKIQFVLGTLEGQIDPQTPTMDELLEINRSVEKTLRAVIKKEMLLQFKLEDILEIQPTEPPNDEPTNGEGCTPGFWKNNLDSWEVYDSEQLFKDVFDGIVIDDDEDLTLLGALELEGGGVNALARHAVAALLNAAHSDVNYPLLVDDVIVEFKAAYESGDLEEIENQKDRFEELNEQDCPLEADPAN